MKTWRKALLRFAGVAVLFGVDITTGCTPVDNVLRTPIVVTDLYDDFLDAWEGGLDLVDQLQGSVGGLTGQPPMT
jgi:hypothetical protein